MNDKQRAEFERWASQHEYDLTWIGAINCYAIMRTRIVFDAWCAAIASVAVDLPTAIIDEFENGDTIEYVEISEIKESLSRAGIRYE